MGKESKKGKINPYYLFITATLLLSAGFLMGPFPVLIFAGMAPLFAVADHAEGEHFWNKIELVLVSLAIGLFAAHGFHIDQLVTSIVQAIALSGAFAAFTFTRQSLGSRLGKLPLILYVLAVEYICLKLDPASTVFLADSMQFKPGWTRWTSHTGYLGISLWILLANMLLYIAVLKKTISIPFLVMFFIMVTAPIAYSFSLDHGALTKAGMLGVYANGAPTVQEAYNQNGEWIPRTAAWVSALILLFAFVKNYTSGK